MLYLLVLIVLGFLVYKFRKRNNFHPILILLMYGFYLLLWFVPKIDTTVTNTGEHIKHQTDSAMGVAILFLFTMPIYLLVHIAFIIYSKKMTSHRTIIFKSHIIGVVLLAIQVVTFLIKTNFLS